MDDGSKYSFIVMARYPIKINPQKGIDLIKWKEVMYGGSTSQFIVVCSNHLICAL